MGGEVKNMRGLVMAIGALVVVAGCGRMPGGPAPTGHYKLYEAASTTNSQNVSVIDSRSHSVELSLPLGTPSPSWTHLYTVTGNSLVDIDPRTGATLHTLALPGAFQLPPATMSGVPGGLSQDGRWLVLQAFDTTSTIPRATHFLLIDTSYANAPQHVDLKGFFNFDAVSNDGRRIFVIQYVTNTEYFVRRYDVGAGQLYENVIFDKSDGSTAMGGLRLGGVPSRDGQWLYSVYVRQDKSSFIHALALDDSGIAFCIDLPGNGYSADVNEFHWSLALSADGSHIYAANGATGIIADVNLNGNGPPSVGRTAHITTAFASSGFFAQDVLAKEFGASGAVLSPDGKTLVVAGQTGVVWVDTASLKAHDRRLASWTVWSLAMSPDGANVYAVNDAGMIAEVPMTGSHTPSTFGGAPGQPLALIRVASP
jgi:hypothetical protein